MVKTIENNNNTIVFTDIMENSGSVLVIISSAAFFKRIFQYFIRFAMIFSTYLQFGHFYQFHIKQMDGCVSFSKYSPYLGQYFTNLPSFRRVFSISSWQNNRSIVVYYKRIECTIDRYYLRHFNTFCCRHFLIPACAWTRRHFGLIFINNRLLKLKSLNNIAIRCATTIFHLFIDLFLIVNGWL